MMMMMMNDDFNDIGTICSISTGWGDEHTSPSEPIIIIDYT
jgi:hypothetical protein